MKKKSLFLRHRWEIFISLLLIVSGFIIAFFCLVRGKTFENSENRDAGEPPIHIERNGEVYFYRGNLVYELPVGYEYTGKAYDNHKEYGNVYENIDYPDGIYFFAENWDIHRDGDPQPYLLYEIIEPEE